MGNALKIAKESLLRARRRSAKLPRSRPQIGFTLIELLVVMVIVMMLVGLLLPAVQRARAAARRISCVNNLKQVGLAIANYESQSRQYPPSWQAPAVIDPLSTNIAGWSTQALLLPYLEQGALYSNVNFNAPYTAGNLITMADGNTEELIAMRVPTYLCPSEERDEQRISGGVPLHYPLNYAVNLGTWFVWDPATKRGGPGSFHPSSILTDGSFGDGLSFTIAMAEVKGWNPYYRNLGETDPANLPMPVAPLDPLDPATPSPICSLGGDFKTSSGHTEWVDGRSHQIGFTTTFRPNERVLCTESGEEYDVDWTNWQEGRLQTAGTLGTEPPTYAAVTARSYHPDGVNVAMMDGSVRWFANTVNLGVWQAYSTRSGKEVIPPDQQGR